jgi:hypothetical protein
LVGLSDIHFEIQMVKSRPGSNDPLDFAILARERKLPLEQAFPVLVALAESGTNVQQGLAAEALRTLTNQPSYRS